MDRRTPFLLLGGDGLLTRRSGIGRMTAEIASRAAAHPGLAGLGMLMNGRFRPFRDDMLAEVAGPASGRHGVASLLGAIAPLRHARNLWRRRRLSQALRRVGHGRGRVVYHETNFISVPFDGPVCVSVHDLICLTHPHLVPSGRRRWVERNLPRVLRDASAFACVSAATAGELTRLFPEAARRVHVVPQGVSPLFRPHHVAEAAPVLARYGVADRSYVFAASTQEPRKNFARLQQAYAGLPPSVRARYKLLIAGGHGWGEPLRPVPGGAILLGHVPDPDLAALTARAAAYAFVSETEGFGLPILEAMASHTPLLTSRGSAMEETACGAARLTDPLDVDAIRHDLHALLDDGAERDRLRQAGALRVQDFTWERTTEQLVTLWSGLCR